MVKKSFINLKKISMHMNYLDNMSEVDLIREGRFITLVYNIALIFSIFRSCEQQNSVLAFTLYKDGETSWS